VAATQSPTHSAFASSLAEKRRILELNLRAALSMCAIARAHGVHFMPPNDAQVELTPSFGQLHEFVSSLSPRSPCLSGN
jgi:hypothetical protein